MKNEITALLKKKTPTDAQLPSGLIISYTPPKQPKQPAQLTLTRKGIYHPSTQETQATLAILTKMARQAAKRKGPHATPAKITTATGKTGNRNYVQFSWYPPIVGEQLKLQLSD